MTSSTSRLTEWWRHGEVLQISPHSMAWFQWIDLRINIYSWPWCWTLNLVEPNTIGHRLFLQLFIWFHLKHFLWWLTSKHIKTTSKPVVNIRLWPAAGPNSSYHQVEFRFSKMTPAWTWMTWFHRGFCIEGLSAVRTAVVFVLFILSYLVEHMVANRLVASIIKLCNDMNAYYIVIHHSIITAPSSNPKWQSKKILHLPMIVPMQHDHGRLHRSCLHATSMLGRPHQEFRRQNMQKNKHAHACIYSIIFLYLRRQ